MRPNGHAEEAHRELRRGTWNRDGGIQKQLQYVSFK